MRISGYMPAGMRAFFEKEGAKHDRMMLEFCECSVK